MELIFNPCSEFRWSLAGPVSQIHSPHLHVGAPGIFSDLLRSVQMLKREWVVESNGKLPYLFSLVKLQPWFLSLRWKTCLWQNRSLCSCTCSEGPALGQNTLMMIYKYSMFIFLLLHNVCTEWTAPEQVPPISRTAIHYVKQLIL